MKATLLSGMSVVGLLMLAAGCNCQSHMDGGTSMTNLPRLNHAIAYISPTKGNHVTGVVHFMAEGDTVHVVANLEGLAPNSTHGFHIHEYGDITGSDGMTTGGHYDPEHTKHHAMPGMDGPHHAGDLGNITADASGNAHYDMTFTDITICEGKNPILGRGVVVHADADDGSQPTGNAGGRIGVGVIGVAKSN